MMILAIKLEAEQSLTIIYFLSIFPPMDVNWNIELYDLMFFLKWLVFLFPARIDFKYGGGSFSGSIWT